MSSKFSDDFITVFLIIKRIQLTEENVPGLIQHTHFDFCGTAKTQYKRKKMSNE